MISIQGDRVAHPHPHLPLPYRLHRNLSSTAQLLLRPLLPINRDQDLNLMTRSYSSTIICSLSLSLSLSLNSSLSNSSISFRLKFSSLCNFKASLFSINRCKLNSRCHLSNISSFS